MEGIVNKISGMVGTFKAKESAIEVRVRAVSEYGCQADSCGRVNLLFKEDSVGVGEY